MVFSTKMSVVVAAGAVVSTNAVKCKTGSGGTEYREEDCAERTCPDDKTVCVAVGMYASEDLNLFTSFCSDPDDLTATTAQFTLQYAKVKADHPNATYKSWTGAEQPDDCGKAAGSKPVSATKATKCTTGSGGKMPANFGGDPETQACVERECSDGETVCAAVGMYASEDINLFSSFCSTPANLKLAEAGAVKKYAAVKALHPNASYKSWTGAEQPTDCGKVAASKPASATKAMGAASVAALALVGMLLA